MCVGFVVGLFVLCFAFSHPSLNRDEDTDEVSPGRPTTRCGKEGLGPDIIPNTSHFLKSSSVARNWIPSVLQFLNTNIIYL